MEQYTLATPSLGLYFLNCFLQKGHEIKMTLSLCLNFVEHDAEQNFLARLCLTCPSGLIENPASLLHIGHLLLINCFFILINLPLNVCSYTVKNDLKNNNKIIDKVGI